MARDAKQQRRSRWLAAATFAALAAPVCLHGQSPAPATAAAGTEASASTPAPSFHELQLRYPRVLNAHLRRGHDVERLLERRGVGALAELFFRVFKREQILEVWARDAGAATFVLVERYPVCGTSGTLGPKRRQGDEQIPEGFYVIDLFNPRSQFHLSLRVDYPNAVDRARGAGVRLGGDVMIHGGCATVGCVPITDERMEEVYLLALSARAAGQARIPVHLFPTHLDEDGFDWLEQTFGSDHPDLPFWRDLRQGYRLFEQTRLVSQPTLHNGRYTFPLGLPQ